MDKKLTTIAEHLRKAFPGDPTIHEYVADDGVRCVNIINTPTNDGVTYLGTIGCSERKMKGLPPEKDIRIELISAVEDKFSSLMAETLSFIAFCLDTDNVCYHPGMVIENAIPESNLTKMRHVYLCEPIILNEALSSIQFDEYPVIFLYVLPLTEKELHFFDDNGSQAIEKQLIGNINPYNLNRKSCVFNEIKIKKRTMDRKELSKVALLLEKKFQGDASFSTYGNASSRECPVVDIITTRHPDHVTYIGTIGCSLIPMRQSKDEVEDWRIEFVTAINEDSEELMTNAMLSIATMMSNLENNCCYPGLVIRNTFPEDCPSQMKHLLLAYPFLWDEGLESISVKKTQIRFLQLLPISDAEADFIDKYGYDALEDKMIEQEVLYNDFYRPSCITESKELDIKEIWKIDDKSSFVIAISEWLDQKCNYGDNILTLTPEEKTFYIFNVFISEVNNGGIDQFLWNSSGAFAGELFTVLHALGAPKIVEIYSRAFACLPELPKDQVQRDNLLSELVTEEISSLFDECDKQFYALEDNVDVDSLEYQFIINNKASFV